MQNYLICFQTPYNSVKYLTNELQSPVYLNYYKFLDYINSSIRVVRYDEFKDHIDKFHTIIINTDTHEWEEMTQEKKEYTFEQLKEYNEKLEFEKENKKAAFNNIERNKNFIEDVVKNKNIGYKRNYLKQVDIPEDARYGNKKR